MKTLILTCNTGEGHNSCATAIKEYFESNREECYIKDGLGFISLKVSHMISWGHTYIYRHLPRLFEHGYGYSERHPDLFRYGSIVYKFIGQGAEKLFACISDGDYDNMHTRVCCPNAHRNVGAASNENQNSFCFY